MVSEVRDAGTGEVITLMELLSPGNKRPGKGRRTYLQKRRAVLGSRTHLVEIDLLRAGQPMPISGGTVAGDYRILVSRGDERPRAVLYAFGLEVAIPPVTVPLRPPDAGPRLEVGSILQEVYERAAYELRVDYGKEPVPPLPPERQAWLGDILRRARA